MRNGLFGIASTGLSGLSNLVVQLFIAALLPAAEFGRFTLFSTTVLFVLGLGRAAIGQTDILRGRPGHDDAPAAAAYSAAGVLGLAGVACIPLVVLCSGTAAAYVAFAVAASAVFVLQDAVRFRAFRMRRAGVALVSDAVLLVLAVAGLLASRSAADPTPWVSATWAAATAIAFLPAAILLRYRPTSKGFAWLKTHRDLVVPSVGEYLLQAGLPYLVNWVVVAAGGLDALAGYRLIQLLFAAVANFALGLNSSLTPRVVDRGSVRYARRVFRYETAAVAGLSVLVLAAALLIPSEVGTAVFRHTWNLALLFLLPAGLHGALNALLVSNYTLLRLLGEATYSFHVRMWTATISALLVAVGVNGWGEMGAAWALALGAAAAYVARLMRTLRRLRTATRTDDRLPMHRGVA